MRSLYCALFGVVLLSSGSVHAGSNGHGNKHGHHGKKHHKHHHDAVAGDFSVVTDPPQSVAQVAPDLCILELTATFSFAGDLDGSFTSEFVIEHFGACNQLGPEYFVTEGVFEGELLGAEGSFEYTFEGAIDGQGIATGDMVIRKHSGTDELEDLDCGTITLTGLAGVGGTYDGEVDLD